MVGRALNRGNVHLAGGPDSGTIIVGRYLGQCIDRIAGVDSKQCVETASHGVDARSPRRWRRPDEPNRTAPNALSGRVRLTVLASRI